MVSRFRLKFLLFVGFGLLLVPAIVQAEEGDFDTLDRLQDLEAEARTAARAKDWSRARELAEIILTLDDTEYTSGARLILVHALEGQSQYGAAIYELKQYQQLEISRMALSRSSRLMRRLEAGRMQERLGESRRAQLTDKARADRAGAASLLIGGVALSASGAYFIGADLYWASKDVPSGSWAIIGGSLLGLGIGLDIAGVVMLRRAQRPSASRVDFERFQRRPRIALSAGPERLAVQVGGVW